jgi:3-hydroxy-9,10-secoandrosta-1,3,5(10)-triene-9,17-dione monooxygenase
MLALFPEAAQNEIWSESPDHLIASALIFPAGHARRVTGGYRLSGRWPFSSGVDNSAWNMLGGTIERDDGDEPELRIFLVPRSDYRILDTWHAMGLAATGSKDVAAEDVFVPEHRTLAIEDLKNGTPPGIEVNAAPLYKLPVFPLFPFILSGVALGIAEGAYEAHLNALESRIATYSGAKVGDFQSVQIKTAEVAAMIDSAGMLMRNACDHAAAMAAASHQPDALTKARYRRDGAFSVSLCTRAVDLIFSLAGGSGIYTRNPMQRAFRDAHAVASHIVFNFDAIGVTYARAALGLPLDNPTL